MKRKSKKKRWLWISAILLVVIGLGLYSKRGQETGIAVTIGEAGRGDITSVVTATGRIHPQIEVRISSEVPGEIVELPVREGQRVSRGDLLVRVNPDTLDAQVMQQEASLQALRASSAQNRAEVLQAEIDLRRVEDLFNRGFASRDQLDQSRTVLEIRRASLEAASYRIEQQEMNLREARDQLAKASTFAPIDGTITRLESELGDRVVGTGQFAGTEIMRIANLATMEVRVDVSETDITSVQIGQEASIEIDALPGRRFEGVVTEIANSAQTAQAGGQEQLTTFSVRVRFNQVDPAMRPGMTATTDIRTKTVENVVRVPLQSVTVRSREIVENTLGDAVAAPRSAPGGDPSVAGPRAARRGGDNLRRVVFVLEGDNSVRMVPVETGIADARFIEITAGLSGNERVVTGPHGALTRELQHNNTVRELSLAPGQRGPRP